MHRTNARFAARHPLVSGLAPVLLLACGPLLAGCGAGHGSHGSPRDAAAPIAVTALSAGGSGPAGGLVLPGRVRASEEVTLAARMTGRLTALPLREGAAFRQGQVLARFDAPEARERVRSAAERAAAARARVEQARADETRMASLRADDVVADRDLELAEVARHAAEAAYAEAEAEHAAAREDAALTAPFDGVVARRHVDPGQSLAPGQPILDLRSRSVGEIETAVPETALPGLAKAGVAFQIGEGEWRAAAIARIDGMTDPATRTRLAYLRPAAPAPLEAGAYVRVRIRGDAANAAGADDASASRPMTVPSRSLVRRGALTGVYVLRDDRAWLRWLRVGREAGGAVEVLSGLAAGDRYAADPAGLSDGCAIRVAE